MRTRRGCCAQYGKEDGRCPVPASVSSSLVQSCPVLSSCLALSRRPPSLSAQPKGCQARRPFVTQHAQVPPAHANARPRLAPTPVPSAIKPPLSSQQPGASERPSPSDLRPAHPGLRFGYCSPAATRRCSPNPLVVRDGEQALGGGRPSTSKTALSASHLCQRLQLFSLLLLARASPEPPRYPDAPHLWRTAIQFLATCQRPCLVPGFAHPPRHTSRAKLPRTQTTLLNVVPRAGYPRRPDDDPTTTRDQSDPLETRRVCRSGMNYPQNSLVLA